MANSIPQKYSVGYGLGGTGVAVDEYGLNLRLGGRCLGGVRIASTGASPIYVMVNARIVGARFADDYRIIPTLPTTKNAGSNSYWQSSFDSGSGNFIKYDSSIVGGITQVNDALSKLQYTKIKGYLPNIVQITFGLNTGSYALELDASVDASFITSYLKTISTTDALVIFPQGYNPDFESYNKEPAYEFPILGKFDDNNLAIDAGSYGANGLKTAPFDLQDGKATALILREVASTNTDDRFAWFNRTYALRIGFPLNPGENIDLVSDPTIPQIFGIAAITDIGQTGAISMLQTRF